MKWIEKRQVAEEWFRQGCDMGASHLIIFFNRSEEEYRPLFVFPEQDVESEVLKLLDNCEGKNTMMVGILSLSDSIERVNAVFRPINVAISRVEN